MQEAFGRRLCSGSTLEHDSKYAKVHGIVASLSPMKWTIHLSAAVRLRSHTAKPCNRHLLCEPASAAIIAQSGARDGSA